MRSGDRTMAARCRRCLLAGRAGYDDAMIKKLVILALLVALGVIAAKRLRGD
jgi:hypothetical protein